MTVTPQRFRKAYTEFRETETGLIQQKLNQAVLRINSEAFGDLADEGVMLLTAHLLSISPEGEKVRLHKDTSKTIYSEELQRMRREVTAGLGRVI